MTKDKAVEIFGSQASLARAIGVSKSAIGAWKDPLTDSCRDRVIAAIVRHRKLSPVEATRLAA